ncbi:hypothetical protein Pan14r_10070 [Crateriforma conspicua]|uniref:Uncharacterized protein n=1 Tax=Crateriforma conspicua TaxID=2527996 RepID=A0A5C5Y0M7_9PLAN|nr:hypothetical protein Mal65_15170 [Crateriforma conspicua]TWT68760.1 hypothetical protein Pan14r_10070 [Crateriforma conspicua]
MPMLRKIRSRWWDSRSIILVHEPDRKRGERPSALFEAVAQIPLDLNQNVFDHSGRFDTGQLGIQIRHLGASFYPIRRSGLC